MVTGSRISSHPPQTPPLIFAPSCGAIFDRLQKGRSYCVVHKMFREWVKPRWKGKETSGLLVLSVAGFGGVYNYIYQYLYIVIITLLIAL